LKYLFQKKTPERIQKIKEIFAHISLQLGEKTFKNIAKKVNLVDFYTMAVFMNNHWLKDHQFTFRKFIDPKICIKSNNYLN
jgi:hypothetical protein